MLGIIQTVVNYNDVEMILFASEADKSTATVEGFSARLTSALPFSPKQCLFLAHEDT